MTTREAFTAWVRAQVGVQEDPRGSNRTPYAALASHANGAAWCLTGLVAGAKVTELQLPYDGAYTPAAESAFKRAGALYATPTPGDFGFLYFTSMGRVAHVFYVLAVAGDVVTTVEFNSNSDGSRDGYEVVTKRRDWRARGKTYVRSFGRPTYAATPTTPAPQEDDDDMGYSAWTKAEREHLLNDIRDAVLIPLLGPGGEDPDLIERVKRIDAATSDDLTGRLQRINGATDAIADIHARVLAPDDTAALTAAVRELAIALTANLTRS